MKTRGLGIVSLGALLTTVVWLVLFIYTMASSPPSNSLDEAIAAAEAADGLFFFSYLNAALVTVSVTLLFGGLYVYCRSTSPVAASMALVFVPVYTLLNLVVYLSQVTILPGLLQLRETAGLGAAAELLASQLVQMWPGSAANFLNNLAYAVLGIPSLIFGNILIQMASAGRLRTAGALLAVSGAASIFGLAGILAKDRLISWGSVISGVFFLLSLVPLSLALLKADNER